MLTNEKIGRNILDVLKSKGMTQSELARRMGHAVSSLNKYLNGGSMIRAVDLYVMAKILNVDVGRLMEE